MDRLFIKQYKCGMCRLETLFSLIFEGTPPAKDIMFQHELLEPGSWEQGLEEMETQRGSERNWDGERKGGET